MSEQSIKTYEQESWSARAAHWAEDGARATALAAPHLISALELAAKQHMLDLCCGPGVIAGAAHALGADVIGVDFAPQMIAQARARLPEVEFRIGDAEALDVREGEFDAIACNFGLQHVAHPEQALREAFRALRSGGRLAWSHWLDASESPITRAAVDALAQHGDPALHDAERLEASYRLAKPAAAAAAMRRAGFRAVETEVVVLDIQSSEDQLLATAHDMLARIPLALDRQPTAARARIDAALRDALLAQAEQLPVDAATLSLKAHALICVGAKLEAAPPRPKRFGIVKKLLGAPKADGAA